jgi:hypothetical protein
MQTMELDTWLNKAMDRKVYIHSVNNNKFVLCGKLRRPKVESFISDEKHFLIENECFYIYFGYDDIVNCDKIDGQLYLALYNLPF